MQNNNTKDNNSQRNLSEAFEELKKARNSNNSSKNTGIKNKEDITSNTVQSKENTVKKSDKIHNKKSGIKIKKVKEKNKEDKAFRKTKKERTSASINKKKTSKFKNKEKPFKGTLKYKFDTLRSKKLNLPDDDIEKLKIGGLFHDIGKIGIPDSILLKESKLTDEEYTKIKDHPLIGYNMLAHAEMFKHILKN